MRVGAWLTPMSRGVLGRLPVVGTLARWLRTGGRERRPPKAGALPVAEALYFGCLLASIRRQAKMGPDVPTAVALRSAHVSGYIFGCATTAKRTLSGVKAMAARADADDVDADLLAVFVEVLSMEARVAAWFSQAFSDVGGDIPALLERADARQAELNDAAGRPGADVQVMFQPAKEVRA